MIDLRGRHCQVGSSAGAARLLSDSAGVIGRAGWERALHVGQEGNARLNLCFRYEFNLLKHDQPIL